MEYRALGRSGLRVSVLTMGTMTFGGQGSFARVGSTDVAEAGRQVDMCLDAGVNLVDTADVYSVSQQIYYSLQAREAEYELIPLAVDQGLGVLVWSPLAGGLLSGKYRRNHEAPAGSRQLTDWGEPPVYDQESLYDIAEVLVGLGEQRGVSAAQVALAWTLGKPAVTSLVIGARTTEQPADNLADAP